jgi:hypothetical protein
MTQHARSDGRKRAKRVASLASAIAVGTAVGAYAGSARVPAQAAGACCQTSWDCYLGATCEIDTTWTCQPTYFGSCQS